ncbi:MAG: response regulator [Bdellovibrionota bacterium]|nr:response regulator [Bdellovibrionota bacterium]
MALRILLADESATIKKVIELSLQDFSLDLKTVNLGVDVLDVARKFQPDIVFVDILLQKKNGYEVCNDLKSDEETQNIPVVLLWSGFMDLDQQKLQVVGADKTLEKPFDSDAIRSLINQLVPQSGQANPLMEHVEIPEIPAPGDYTQVRSLDEINKRLTANEASRNTQAEENSSQDVSDAQNWSMDSFDSLPELDFPDEDEAEAIDALEEEDDFSHFELKTPSLAPEEAPETLIELAEEEENDNEWLNQSLGKFKLDLPDEDNELEELENLDIAEDISVPENTAAFLWTPEREAELQKLQERSESLESQPEAEQEETEEEAPEQAPAAIHAIHSLPSEEEIANAPEIELGHEHEELEFENNSDLGIETIESDLDPVTQASASSQNTQELEQYIHSPAFQNMIRGLVEERVQAIVEKAIPTLAKDAIEKEIQRLLDEPY